MCNVRAHCRSYSRFTLDGVSRMARRTSNPCDRINPLRVYVDEDDRARIKELAHSCGMTVSAFVRTAALGYRVRSVLDLEAVRTLAKINTDQAALRQMIAVPTLPFSDRGALAQQITEVQGSLVEAARRVKI